MYGKVKAMWNPDNFLLTLINLLAVVAIVVIIVVVIVVDIVVFLIFVRDRIIRFFAIFYPVAR